MCISAVRIVRPGVERNGRWYLDRRYGVYLILYSFLRSEKKPATPSAFTIYLGLCGGEKNEIIISRLKTLWQNKTLNSIV